MSKLPPLLNTVQVARRLKCSVRTVNRLAAAGELPFEQKMEGRTGSYLFTERAVAKFELARSAQSVQSASKAQGA